MKLTKTFAAIAAASALLILAATPASATVYSFEVTGGTLTTTTLGTFTFGGGGTPTPPCTNFSTDVDTLTADVNDTTGASTITAVALTSSLTASGNNYKVEMTKHTGANTGTINPATLAVAHDLSVRITFKATTGAPTCVVGTTVCTLQANFNSTAPATRLTGTATGFPFGTTDSVDVSGTGLVTGILGQPCSAPFATLATTTVGMANLILDVI